MWESWNAFVLFTSKCIIDKVSKPKLAFSTFEYLLPDDDQRLDGNIDITIFLDMFLGMQVTSDLSIPFYTSEK